MKLKTLEIELQLLRIADNVKYIGPPPIGPMVTCLLKQTSDILQKAGGAILRFALILLGGFIKYKLQKERNC
jgi:hypothetical protein